MSEPTIGRLKQLIAAMSDENLILAIGVGKDSDIKLLTCPADASAIQKSIALQNQKQVKWMQRT